MKKKVYTGIAVVAIICVIFIIVKINGGNKKFDYTIEKVGEANYFLLMQDNKYGVIDRCGNVIIEPIYDIVEIPNQAKDIFICKGNYNAEKNEYSVQVYNEKGESILYQYYIVEAIGLNNVQGNGNYEKSTLKYKSEGKYGLIDLSGKKITEPVYESIEGFEYVEGLLKVQKSGKFGIVNINGAVVVKPEYDEVLSDGYYSENNNYKDSGYIVGKRTDGGMRYGYINCNRERLLKNEYNEIYRIEKNDDKSGIYLVAYKNGRAGLYHNKKIEIKHDYEKLYYSKEDDLFIVQKMSKQGIMKPNGEIVVPIEYENVFFAGNYVNAQKNDNIDIYDINNGLIHEPKYISERIYQDGKYKIVSTAEDEYKIIVKENNIVIEDGYSYIQYLYNNYFIVKKESLFGIVDDTGRVVIEPKYTAIQPVSGFEIIELIDKDDNVLIINSNIEEIITAKSENIHDYDKYIKITNKNEIKYIGENGKEIAKETIFPESKLFTYVEKGKWGFKDKDGNVIVEAAYDLATEFNKYGYAGIKKNDLWGVIDGEGNIIVKPTYNLEQEPNFIKEYYEINLGYGDIYYTN